MNASIRRRDILTMLCGAATLSLIDSRVVRAQRPKPSIGYLGSGSLDNKIVTQRVAAFQRGLGEAGFVNGQNVTIEFRWAADRNDRLPELAAEFVRRDVSVIAAQGTDAVLAARAATSTIPIVFAGGFDPLVHRLVTSYGRPGGNITGATFFSTALEAKRLAFMRLLVPHATLIGALINPDNANAALQERDLKAEAQRFRVALQVGYALQEADLELAFHGFTEKKAGALVIATDGFLGGQRRRIATLAERHGIPTIYGNSHAAAVGGLMSYGTRAIEAEQHAGYYVGRILRGEKPEDLPVISAVKAELVINLKTAKTLGLSVPEALLLAADEVIE